MEDLYEVRNSLYCYENTDVLKNKLNIKNNKELAEVERKIVLAKLYELRQKEVVKEFTLEQFVWIHRFLFEDIYPFAGLFRNENIAKGNFRFAEWQYIEQEIRRLMQELKEENYLEGVGKEKLIKRLAYYMSELNVIHPFREGNGRTIRQWIRQLALYNGYLLDLQQIKPKEMLEACITSVIDTSDLEKVLAKCLKKMEE